MRFISDSARYSIQVEEPVERITDNGRLVVTQKPLVAHFNQGGLSPWEMETALKHFSAKGLPEGIPPATRFSHYDTEGIRDAVVRERVEQALLNSFDFGRDFIKVEKPKRPAPWGNYDRFKNPVKIVEMVKATETDVEQVLAYEWENQRRPDVIEALEEIREKGYEPVEVEA